MNGKPSMQLQEIAKDNCMHNPVRQHKTMCSKCVLKERLFASHGVFLPHKCWICSTDTAAVHDKIAWNTWNCVICYAIVTSSHCDHGWSFCCACVDLCLGYLNSQHDPDLSPSHVLAHDLHAPSPSHGLYCSSLVVSAVYDLRQFSETNQNTPTVNNSHQTITLQYFHSQNISPTGCVARRG
jgi:hypothetical protein